MNTPVHGLSRFPFAALAAGIAVLVGTSWRATGGQSADGLPPVRVAKDGRTFETSNGARFIPMGINYFRPGTGWAPQVWKQFDAAATRKDFELMKSMGVNCVRVFLTYGSFLQEPGGLSPEGLAKLDQFLELAENAGLYVHPTGPDHWEGLPAWARTDRMVDEQVLAALEVFWKQLAAHLRGRSVIFAYDLLNEPEIGWDSPIMKEKWNRHLAQRYGSPESLASAWGIPLSEIKWGDQPPPPVKDAPASPELLCFQRFREELADIWTRRQVRAIKEADPGALVTVGLIQWSVPTLLGHVRHYSGFRPDRQAKFLDFMEIHFYPLEGGFYTYAGEEAESRNLAYLESVVREVAKPGKPVVVAEFGWYGGGKPTIDGGRHPEASEDQQARWCRRLVESTQTLATGWLNWGFYDQPEARDVSELIGLMKPDGTPKAWGREFQAIARSLDKFPRPDRMVPSRPDPDWDSLVTSMQAGADFRLGYRKAWNAARDTPRK